MGILQLPTPLVGQGGLLPATKLMVSTDDLATVTAAGYLNNVSLEGYPINQSDLIQMLYNYIPETGVGVYALFVVSIANGVITLNKAVEPGDVTVTGGAPVTGHFATWSGTNSIQDGGVKGTASSRAASDVTKANLASVNGAAVVGHVATFSDVAGTIQDGGVLGQAAAKAVSDNTKASVASVQTPTVAFNLVEAVDTAGTIGDAGIAVANVQKVTDVKANTHAIAGGGPGPYIIPVVGLTVSSIVIAVPATLTTNTTINNISVGSGSFSVEFVADPGASTINYIAYIAAQ
jgi:hypothetical protein